jgi:cysteinyl-tRNA synthetase
MTLKIYDTLEGKKRDFVPVKDGEVKMYVCGVTVYDRCHIGHARAGVVFDFLYRALKYLGYKTTYVRNFNDVDDKIINRAAERKISCDELVKENIDAFYEDMDSLFILRPDHEPRATDYIPQMQELIKALIAKGLAYTAGGDVFFAVEKFPNYGKLSKRSLDEMLSGARVAVNEDKKNPFDFALWKAAKPGEPKWPSPWGEGRPGWHIECSAMGKELLGVEFDIHGGGKDLVFPHHENEIAQSEGASGHVPARYWMHNGFVNINKEKMSKSLGNFFTIRDVTAKFDPEAVRLYLLSTHYRSPIDFADEYLREAEWKIDYLYRSILKAQIVLKDFEPDENEKKKEKDEAKDKIKKLFNEALEDDFNSAAVVALLYDVAKKVNNGSTFSSLNMLGGSKELLYANRDLLFLIGKDVLGILNYDPKKYLDKIKAAHLKEIEKSESTINNYLTQREDARKLKNFTLADSIRDTLLKDHIGIEDSPDGSEWFPYREKWPLK